MKNDEARAYQEKFITHARDHHEQLREVLASSGDDQQRAVAAIVLGYASDKNTVIEDLRHGMQDPDLGVRNNSMRALGAIARLAGEKPERGIHIDPSWFVDYLNSVYWTDRNKALMALIPLTENRDSAILDRLRKDARESLIEMASWQYDGHALSAYILLGRVENLSDSEIMETWEEGKRYEVIAKFEAGE